MSYAKHVNLSDVIRAGQSDSKRQPPPDRLRGEDKAGRKRKLLARALRTQIKRDEP